MTPSERIKYIKQISKLLGKEKWELIDLTLKQFSLPWTNQWDGANRVDYVMDMIDTASDESLLTLSKHLGIVSEIVSIKIPLFWKPSQPRVFITHLAKIKDKAATLRNNLENILLKLLLHMKT